MECKCGTNKPEDCSGCQASLREVCWGDTLDSENSPILSGLQQRDGIYDLGPVLPGEERVVLSLGCPTLLPPGDYKVPAMLSGRSRVLSGLLFALAPLPPSAHT